MRYINKFLRPVTVKQTVSGELTVLIDQHANGNAGHEKSVQKILNIILSLNIHIVGVFELQDTLRHRLNNVGVPVPDLYQSLTESAKKEGFSDLAMISSKRLLNSYTHLSNVVLLISTFSNCKISSNEVAYKLFTIPRLGIFSRLSGSKWISFIILASRTGSSFLRNIKDFLSQALRPERYNRQCEICLYHTAIYEYYDSNKLKFSQIIFIIKIFRNKKLNVFTI